MTDTENKNKTKTKMKTLEDLKACTKQFLDPADIAPFLQCDQFSINLQAQADPSKLGFPVCVMGRRVRIPRVGFIKWYEWTVMDPC